ncbi:MAG: hypothetical protein WBD07_15665 [Vicinamibacterales bacterium]
MALRFIGILLLGAVAAAQGGATGRLLALLRSSDPGRNHKEFLTAVVEAGPAALPALDQLLGPVGPAPNAQSRKYVLASIGLIGGSQALSIIRGEYDRGDKTLKPALAAVLATADSPQSRASLVGMLGEDPDDIATLQAAALALGILRAPEGASALQSFSASPHSPEAEIAELALHWMAIGEWRVDVQNGGERDRALAAVLRNGIPGVPETVPVFDEDTRRTWKYGASGWKSSPTQAADRATFGPTAYSVISANGVRAAVSIESRCGPGCGGGSYDFILRKVSGQWRVQSIFPASIG